MTHAVRSAINIDNERYKISNVSSFTSSYSTCIVSNHFGN